MSATLLAGARGAAPAVGLRSLGTALPRRTVTNDELSLALDTDDTWIRTRTGIRERRLCAPGESTGDLAVAAGRQALDRAGGGVDLVVVATATPDHRVPATAPEVAHRLGLGGVPAFDLAAVCSGFVYAVVTACAAVRSGTARTVLVVGAERFSTLLDPADRSTAVLFGDGAGAAVLGAVEPGAPGEVVAVDLGADGSGRGHIEVPGGGARQPAEASLAGPSEAACRHLRMEGREVFSRAVAEMSASVARCLDAAGWAAVDVARLVAHQANLRILTTVAATVGIDPARAAVHLDRVGNTSAASVPLALADTAPGLATGDRLALTAFGAGLTWGSVLLTWPGPAAVAPTGDDPAPLTDTTHREIP